VRVSIALATRIVLACAGAVAASAGCVFAYPFDDYARGGAAADDGGAPSVDATAASDAGGESGAPCVAGTDLRSDPDNCGACGHGCLGGACSNATCLPAVVASGQGALRGIVADGRSVFWAGAGFVAATPRDVIAPTTIASFEGTGFRMAELGDYVYWVTRDTGLVARAKKTGGATETLAANQGDVGGIATDGATVYWDTYPDGSLYSKPLDSSGPATVLDQGSNLTGVQLRGGFLYYIEDSSLRRLKVGTTSTSGPYLARAGTFELVADDAFLYAASAEGDAVVRVPVAGGSPQQLADASSPWGFAADDAFVYWANEDSGDVDKIRKDGAGGTIVLANVDGVVGVAVDDLAVYFTTKTGLVMRVAK
jgi:hypothetical protein